MASEMTITLRRAFLPLEVAFGPGALAVDFLRGASGGRELRELLGPRLTEDGAVTAQLAAIDRRSYPRADLAQTLGAFQREIGADEQAIANAEALDQARTVVVVTGQQPGLLTGPLYTIYKAASAIRLARKMSAEHGRRFVPVFWVAGEDHDAAEIDHVYLPSPNGPRRVRARLPGDGRSISDLTLDFWRAFRADVAEALNSAPQTAAVLERIDAARAGANDPARLFSRLMARLFAGTGLVMVEPQLLRRLAVDVLVREVQEAGAETNRLIAEAGAQVERLGYTPQLPASDGALNVYIYEQGIRSKLEAVGDAVRIGASGRLLSRTELAEQVRRRPEAFSTGVALRPVLQDAVLPTAVYVGGPSEIAYFAQLRRVHEHFGALFPLVWPRASVTLVEPEIAALAAALGVEAREWFAGADRMRDEVSRRGGCRAGERMRAIEDEITEHVEQLTKIAAEMDPSLARVGRKVLAKTRRDLEKFREKVCRAELRSRGLDPRAADRLADAIVPRRIPQERCYNLMPFLARYGDDLVTAIIESIDPLATEHQLLYLPETF